MSCSRLLARNYFPVSPSSAENRWQPFTKRSPGSNHQWTASDVEALFSSTDGYCSLAYSALACFRMGVGSRQFQVK